MTGSFFKCRNRLAIRGRTKFNAARPEFADAEKFIERFCAAAVARVCISQQEPGNCVHALRAKKIFERKDDGLLVTAVDEPVVILSSRINVNCMSAIERKHGQISFSKRCFP